MSAPMLPFSTTRSRVTRCMVCLATTALCTALSTVTYAQPIATAPGESALAPPQAAAARLNGLPNFGVVNTHLFRGAQPEERGFMELKRLGVDIVVSFRNNADQIVRERRQVEAHQMQFVSLPWSGEDDPKPEQMAEFLRLVRDNPSSKVFVHCKRGSERTGVMIAAYRISEDGWTAEQALAEMKAFGFRSRFSHLTRFVRELASWRVTSPSAGSS